MKKSKLYAVLTGDIVDSSDIPVEKRKILPAKLRDIFRDITENFSIAVERQFQIYRGDSFQGVLSKPELALTISIFLKARLKAVELKKATGLRTRIAIGIGTLDFLPLKGTEGDGEAFRKSGNILDYMKKKKRELEVWTPSEEVNKEFDTELGFLDFLIERWSKAQSKAIVERIKGATQKKIAKELGVSQPAIHERLKAAGIKPIENLLERYKDLITGIINSECYNGNI